jgi:hypothetical protein
VLIKFSNKRIKINARCTRSLVTEFLPQHRGRAASTTKPTMAIDEYYTITGQSPGTSTIWLQHHQCHRADDINRWRFYGFLQPVPLGGGFLRTFNLTDPSHLHMTRPTHSFIIITGRSTASTSSITPSDPPAGLERILTDALVPGEWCPHRRQFQQSRAPSTLRDGRVRVEKEQSIAVPRVVVQEEHEFQGCGATQTRAQTDTRLSEEVLTQTTRRNYRRATITTQQLVRQGCDDWADNPIS